MTITEIRTKQPRERAVPCQECRHETWNTSAVCDCCETTNAQTEV